MSCVSTNIFDFTKKHSYTNICLMCTSDIGQTALFIDEATLSRYFDYFNYVFNKYRGTHVNQYYGAKQPYVMPNITCTSSSSNADILEIPVEYDLRSVRDLLTFITTGQVPFSLENLCAIYIIAHKWHLVDYFAELLLNRMKLHNDWTRIISRVVTNDLTHLRTDLIERILSHAGVGNALANVPAIEHYIGVANIARMPTQELIIFITMRCAHNHDYCSMLPILFKNHVTRGLKQTIELFDFMTSVLEERREKHGVDDKLVALKVSLLETLEQHVRIFA